MRTPEPTLPTSRQNLPPAEIDCKWWKQGYCFRGSTCYFRHDAARAGIDKSKFEANREKKEQRESETGGNSACNDGYSASPSGSVSLDNAAVPSASIQEQCAICFQIPSTLGLLVNCDHVFCLKCIQDWRASAKQTTPSNRFDLIDDNNSLKKASKTCPICRTHSDFIVPSSVFPTSPPKAEIPLESIVTGKATESERGGAKQEIINDYLARLKTIPCRYFEDSVKQQHESSAFKPVCRFGNDCHYAHSHPITRQPYIFSSAELDAIKGRQTPNRRRARHRLAERILTAEMMLWDLAALELVITSDEEDDWSSD